MRATHLLAYAASASSQYPLPLIFPRPPSPRALRSGAALGALVGLRYGVAAWPQRWTRGLAAAEEVRQEVAGYAAVAERIAGVAAAAAAVRR